MNTASSISLLTDFLGLEIRLWSNKNGAETKSSKPYRIRSVIGGLQII